MSKMSLRFAEKTTSPRSIETSKDSIATNCGVRSLPSLTSLPLVILTVLVARFAHSTLAQRSPILVAGGELGTGLEVAQATNIGDKTQNRKRTEKYSSTTV